MFFLFPLSQIDKKIVRTEIGVLLRLSHPNIVSVFLSLHFTQSIIDCVCDWWLSYCDVSCWLLGADSGSSGKLYTQSVSVSSCFTSVMLWPVTVVSDCCVWLWFPLSDPAEGDFWDGHRHCSGSGTGDWRRTVRQVQQLTCMKMFHLRGCSIKPFSVNMKHASWVFIASCFWHVTLSPLLVSRIVERGYYSERDAAHVIKQILEAVAVSLLRNLFHL